MTSDHRLTKTLVDSLNPGPAVYEVRDRTLKGFGVRVHPTGRKSFVVSYRAGRGRIAPQRRETLGSYGKLTVDEARTKAKTVLANVALNRDPVGDRRGRSPDIPMADMLHRFLDEHVDLKLKPKTQADYRWIVLKRLIPCFRGKTVAKVCVADVLAFHRAYAGRPRQANLMLAVLSKAFSLAEMWGLREGLTNPCRSVPRYAEPPRERSLDASELASIRAALATVALPPSIRLGLGLLIETGARAGEICGLRWTFVDEANERIVWPDTKTGRHTKELSPAAVALLSSAQRDSEYVCPAPRDRNAPIRRDVLRAGWLRVLRSAGVHPCGLHVIRHTYATALYTDKATHMAIGMLAMGHRSLQTALRYTHPSRSEVRNAVARAGRRLA